MLLRLRTQPDRAVVYWEKWSAAITGLLAGAFCVGFAVTFHRLSADVVGAAYPFLLVFCTLFALAGIAALALLPRQVRRLAQEDGAAHLEIDARGIAVTPTLGAEPRRLAWDRIDAVHLADRLKTIEHGETGYAWRVVLIMPTADDRASSGPTAQRQAGALRSGEGRPYLAAGFPRGKAAAVLDALRRHAPPGLVLRHHAEVVFDRKQQRDRFGGRDDTAPPRR